MVKVAKWCLIASWLIGLGATASAKNGAVVKELRCEYRANPLGIDVHWPRLSWILESDQRGQKQTAYRVLVASRKELIEKDRGDLWDSGRVNSDQSIQVPYAGAALLSYQQCFWKVRVWDKDSQPTKWSQPALWTMGLLSPSDWHGQWIGLDQRPEPSEVTQPLDKAHWIWFPDDDPV